jgi:transcriptional regulator with XRE-family HTH domain
MPGYGELIRIARETEGYSPEAFAALFKRTKNVVYRWEAEESKPNLNQINKMVSLLPLSAETLLRAMDVELNPPEAMTIPNRLVKDILVCMRDPEALKTVETVAKALRDGLDRSGPRT